MLILRLGIQTSFTVVIVFVLTWWIVNEFEKGSYKSNYVVSQAERILYIKKVNSPRLMVKQRINSEV